MQKAIEIVLIDRNHVSDLEQLCWLPGLERSLIYTSLCDNAPRDNRQGVIVLQAEAIYGEAQVVSR
jgi:hypothetical protein